LGISTRRSSANTRRRRVTATTRSKLSSWLASTGGLGEWSKPHLGYTNQHRRVRSLSSLAHANRRNHRSLRFHDCAVLAPGDHGLAGAEVVLAMRVGTFFRNVGFLRPLFGTFDA